MSGAAAVFGGTRAELDATVVGAGPNGLVAAVVLARAGLMVELVERAEEVGGGLRSAELTLSGFLHDRCSAVHPGALASPFFRGWGLTERVPFAVPEVSFGHALPGRALPGRALLAHRDLDRTAAELDARDPGAGRAWRAALGPLAARADAVAAVAGLPPARLLGAEPDAGLTAAAAFAAQTVAVSGGLLSRHGPAAALLAGTQAHAGAALASLPSIGAGLLLATLAHGRGWGLPLGGSRAIAEALATDLLAAGGSIRLGAEVRSPADLTPSRAVLLDTSPEFAARFAGTALPPAVRARLAAWRRGPGVAKVDFALSGPVPWADARLADTPTVHIGGGRAAIAAAEWNVLAGRIPDEPFVIVVQPCVVDPGRAPAGRHTLWASCHVPTGSELDATGLVTARIESVAPGFRDTVLAAVGRSAAELARENPNDVGGEIQGGALTLARFLLGGAASWRLPSDGLFLCSAATAPGPSTHGRNGHAAALVALRERFHVTQPPQLKP